jgi:SAM-dependent methyltransferase
MCANFHIASDKTAFLTANAAARHSYFANRYHEWVQLNTLLAGLKLEGSRVLDIGAGPGFDSQRLSLRGAKVTALEISPLLAESGNLHFPHIRWVGCSSDALPFASQSFDTVFFNAALHHMRNIPAAIGEALRVLRPGGVLVTSSDPFRPSGASESAELDIFDEHPAVHTGINERLPQFSEFISTLVANRELLDIELYTQDLRPAPTANGGRADIVELTKWDFDKDREMISQCAGSIAMRVALKRSLPYPARRQTKVMMRAGEYAESLGDQSTAMARLASMLPSEYVDRRFPHGRDDKFEMLNGWRRSAIFGRHRRAYQRGRWFLSRKVSERYIACRVRPLATTPPGQKVSLLLNREVLATVDLVSQKWTPITAEISKVAEGEPFVVEVRSTMKDESMDVASFDVGGLGCYRSLASAEIAHQWRGIYMNWRTARQAMASRRAELVCSWNALVYGIGFYVLGAGILKSILIVPVVLICVLLNYGGRWILRAGFGILVLTVLVITGALPPVDQWHDELKNLIAWSEQHLGPPDR